MALTIAQRFRPFSHVSGTLCLLPRSSLVVQVYVGRIIVSDEILDITGLGPLKQFCVVQDLEHGFIEVSGFAKAGFVRYKIVPKDKSFAIHFSKLPCPVTIGNTTYTETSMVYQKFDQPRERLFLGVDKSQDVSMIMRRMNMAEILPYIYWLSQSVTCHEYQHQAPSLVNNVQQANRTSVLECFTDLITASITSLFVPQLVDSGFHGYTVPVTGLNQSPLALLDCMRKMIRALFFTEDNGTIRILPLLPNEFPSGTITDIRTKKGHTISIEWTKHTIRRVSILAAVDDELTFEFQKEVREFRCKTAKLDGTSKIKIQANQTYLLDNFQQ
ncbi:MAG: hypothetical protein LLF94_09915 [Chlamydiales bacterium]|nr:hypothetical protein [Chlamydiales bacterium]